MENLIFENKRAQKEREKSMKEFQMRVDNCMGQRYSSQHLPDLFPHSTKNVTTDSSSYSDSSDFTTTSEELLKNQTEKATTKTPPIKKAPIKKTPAKKTTTKKETTVKNNKKDTNKNITINNYISNTSPEEKIVNVPTQTKFTLEELKKYKVDGLKELCVKNNIVIKKGAIRTDYETALIKL
jgi:hypothetical protein